MIVFDVGMLYTNTYICMYIYCGYNKKESNKKDNTRKINEYIKMFHVLPTLMVLL